MTLRLLPFLAVLVLGATGCVSPGSGPSASAIVPTQHQGWPEAYKLKNAYAEAVVVPSLGRLMHFGFRGEDSVLWENPVLLGKPMPANPWSTPGSFGGDKTWPAPQSQWNWPPPTAFDAAACDAKVDGDSLVLTTPIDARTGIRAVRRFTLVPFEPILEVKTTYEKVQGDPLDVSIWVISQFCHPEGVYIRVPKSSQFPEGYTLQGEPPGQHLTRSGDLLRMTRSSGKSYKIGSDASAVLWVGTNHMCLVEIQRVPGATYPDNGSSVEIYTNPDPAAYVELETLAPLRRMKAGDSESSVNRYTLKRRRRSDPTADAQPVL